MFHLPSHYRPDIDGLRAVAVTLVVLGHAGVAGFSGGFIGVDVFFVISGFLIIGIVARELHEQRFSLLTFYERRARRILPAFFAMLLATAGLAVYFMLPGEAQEFAKNMRYSLFSALNILLAKGNQDYFAIEPQSKPLLHTWSLGVEEQFYLAVPLLMMVFGRNPRTLLRNLRILLGATGGIAFGLAVWRIRKDPGSCFYLLHFRAWELAAGGLVALLPNYQPNAFLRRAAGWLGGMLIAIACVCYSEATLFPGAAALLPVLGSALIIFAGRHNHSGLGHLLAWKPMVVIGLMSYSVYLWHWPILAFYDLVNATSGSMRSPWFPPLFVGVSYLVGYFCWKWIETPFRDKAIWPRRSVFLFSGAGIALLLVVALSTEAIVWRLFAWREPEACRIYRFQESRNPFGGDARKAKPEAPFIYGDRSQKPTIALCGDSHADHYAYMLHQAALQHRQAIAAYIRFGDDGLPVLGDGATYFDQVIRYVAANPAIETVILAARWNAHCDGRLQGSFPNTSVTDPYLKWLNGDEAQLKLPGIRELYASRLQETIDLLGDAGKVVYLVYPTPETGCYLPRTLSQLMLAGKDPREFTLPAQTFFYDYQKFILDLFDTRLHHHQLRRIRPHPFLIDGDRVRIFHADDVLFRDESHLTLEAAELLAPLFAPVFTGSPAD